MCRIIKPLKYNIFLRRREISSHRHVTWMINVKAHSILQELEVVIKRYISVAAKSYNSFHHRIQTLVLRKDGFCIFFSRTKRGSVCAI